LPTSEAEPSVLTSRRSVAKPKRADKRPKGACWLPGVAEVLLFCNLRVWCGV